MVSTETCILYLKKSQCSVNSRSHFQRRKPDSTEPGRPLSAEPCSLFIPSYLKPLRCWLRLFTLIAYRCKLIGIHSLAA
ncbi:hypothetical protein CD201_14990 [Hafnia alvei]|nr:hypothetical protein CD201_14990 [Hafnia alvei]